MSREEPSHDEALDALAKIRKAFDFADLCEAKHAEAKREAAELKVVVKGAIAHARGIARAITRPLPLFDEKDGMNAPGDNAPAGTGTRAPPASGIFGPLLPRKSKKSEPTEPASEPQARPHDDVWVTVLVLPEEVHKALADFGFKQMKTLLGFHRGGCDWTNIPGIDEAGASGWSRPSTSSSSASPRSGPRAARKGGRRDLPTLLRMRGHEPPLDR